MNDARKTAENDTVWTSTRESLLLISAWLCIEIQSLLLSPVVVAVLYSLVCVRMVGNLFVEIHLVFSFALKHEAVLTSTINLYFKNNLRKIN